MTFQALAALLISWVLPPETPGNVAEGELPVWEKHPAEQRSLREAAQKSSLISSWTTRPW